MVIIDDIGNIIIDYEKRNNQYTSLLTDRITELRERRAYIQALELEVALRAFQLIMQTNKTHHHGYSSSPEEWTLYDDQEGLK